MKSAVSLAPHFLFPVILRIPQIRKWRDKQVNIHSFGVFPDATKLWHQLKKDCRNLAVAKMKIVFIRARLRIADALHVRRRNLPAVKPVRKFIIALVDRPPSMKAAQCCIKSAREKGEGEFLEIMPAVDRFHSEAFFREHGLTWHCGFSVTTDPFAGMGCFASHYKLWQQCVEIGEPIVILEHDVQFTGPIPPLRFQDIIVLAKERTYIPGRRGTRQEVAHIGNHLWGTHAYAITPGGAQKLLRQATRELLPPVDWFMRKKHIDIRVTARPPLKLRERFSSIANRERYTLSRQ